MAFLRMWGWGYLNPPRAFDELAKGPAPLWGFWAVLIRWGGSALTSGLLAWLLLHQPATPSRLTLPFLTDTNYYAIAIFFAPIFGIAIWMFWSAIIHVVVRLAGQPSDFDQILNVVGIATLIPAPVVWAWDSIMIIQNRLYGPEAGLVHILLGIWGIVLFTIGMRQVLGMPIWAAASLTVLIFSGVYVPLTGLWIR